nr:MAG TPA: hypothetical protein [Caudoviricetes sp.]
MKKVLLVFNGKADYLFEIENIEELNKAVEYKNNKIEEAEFGMSDFEYILEYLDNNAIEYNYIDLFDIEQIEY